MREGGSQGASERAVEGVRELKGEAARHDVKNMRGGKRTKGLGREKAVNEGGREKRVVVGVMY